MKHPQRGYALLDALLAATILGLGLLGIAFLQLNGLQLSHDSTARQTAQILAMDLADRMRLTPGLYQDSDNGLFDFPEAGAVGNPNCLGLNQEGSADNSQCSVAEMASHDVYEWESLIRGRTATGWHGVIPAALNEGRGVVCIDSTPEDGLPPPFDTGCDGQLVNGAVQYVIKIWWTEQKDAGSPNQWRRFILPVGG